jgi:hypothetical protein
MRYRIQERQEKIYSVGNSRLGSWPKKGGLAAATLPRRKVYPIIKEQPIGCYL